MQSNNILVVDVAYPPGIPIFHHKTTKSNFVLALNYALNTFHAFASLSFLDELRFLGSLLHLHRVFWTQRQMLGVQQIAIIDRDTPQLPC